MADVVIFLVKQKCDLHFIATFSFIFNTLANPEVLEEERDFYCSADFAFLLESHEHLRINCALEVEFFRNAMPP